MTILSEPRGSFALPAVNDFQIRVDKDLRSAAARGSASPWTSSTCSIPGRSLTLQNNMSQVTRGEAVRADADHRPAADVPDSAPLSVLISREGGFRGRLQIARRGRRAGALLGAAAVSSQGRSVEWRYFGGDKASRDIRRSIRSTATTSRTSRSSGAGLRSNDSLKQAFPRLCVDATSDRRRS